MSFLHAINSDYETRLLNVFGQIAMFWGDKKITSLCAEQFVTVGYRIRVPECLFVEGKPHNCYITGPRDNDVFRK